MSMLEKLKLIRGGADRPRVRKTADVSATVSYLETSRLVATLIFVATVAAIVVISFVGVSTASVPVLPNQLASVRIVAGEPFTYESAERTRLLREQIRDRVPPVFRLEFEPLRQFEVHMRDLLAALNAFEARHATTSAFTGTREADLAAVVEAFNVRGPYRASVNDVSALLAAGDAAERFALVENGLVVLREIYAQGVHDNSALVAGPDSRGVTVFQISRGDGNVAQQAVESIEEALTLLRINLAAEGAGREASQSLFRLFRNGVTPNLIYDQEATRQRQADALKNLKPVDVTVERGQTIIEPGTRVTVEQYEMLVAHRQFLLATGDVAITEGLQLFGRILLVLAMLMACVFYIRLEDRETLQSNSRLGLLALVVIVNLALIRLVYSLGSLPFFVENSAAASLLPYLAPTALAPLIVVILIDAGSAVFMALLISIFTGVIYGNRLDLLVLTFLASMVGISAARASRKRSNVVRAAFSAGITVAAFAFLIGVVDKLPLVTVLKHMGAGLATGVVTGIIVVGILPVLEGLFRRTTDITLLELTDYNHPLLRLMQMEAPGTYHHSLVVAQLAENAANAISANPLLARVCALYHDIGKTTKPEYFTENQRDGVNPHDFSNPSLSALIIKSHVKEGVDLALKHRLPRAAIDVIQQHHGTSLIRYFFQRAINSLKSPAGNTPSPFPSTSRADCTIAPGLEPVPVSETTYRYDGPKPQFKESAIIHLADAVEAASRSLRKVTPQHLGEIIDQIFHERMEDGQLDEAPLTFLEISKIKSSFTFTLLNMLHARVAYPAADNEAGGRTAVTGGA
ncbi:MAG TPA: HDIG domain-containing protein [Opitutaceae bacterium]